MSYAPNSMAARDVAYAMHPYTNLALHEERGPTILTRGEGIYVWDDEGNKYLEGLAGLWCTALGYSEQRLIDAAVKQLGTLPFAHTFAHRSTIPVIELCEALIKIAPGDMGKVFLVNSGSEAVDAAIKMIWYYNNALGRPEKKKIISRKRGYHGVTIAGGSLTAIPLMQNDFDLPLERFLHTDTPSYYRHGQEGESEEEFATRLAASLNDLIEAEGPENVAAFVAEPVMGAGGVIVPPATYFEKVQEVLARHDVLMVADEVICGFGRTGNMWGSQTYGIKPDIVTCAKQLSSAYLPIAAVMISDPIYQAFVEQSRKHGAYGSGHTYGGHPVSAAVALETLRIYQERDIVGHVRQVTPRFQTRLHALGEHPLVGEARGIGLIGAVEIVADKASRQQYPPEVKAGAIIAEKIFEHGLIVRGLPGDAVATCPPLIIDEKQIDELFDKFERGLDDAAKALKA
ncbi:MAG: aminotransferase class III-fold pyridoxal phosphate-dependent enzyme [Gammaproteobacteria bacterium]|nr:aminotransferase class III-fold pyridoxal phosphate-dependent enzyme [Gammaproteobacteria bacterium]NIM72111.1 aminotransferase class III-fold pyridoxal phosphate-dependent enzyme [Gammaproteobacteria bacterium]NIN38392.1 aminotransferase class III-fold pyridoxal phosphate-dependent enzyme [Gammaproteobacteria bacterium]NIO23838.1 aminotransferase class III-fold pyridoxal phosphate-dependent enzyme [Gammaproteobacteria bacterium]NIO64480.1 aminotransferase class III-fold pyridoxal phosphate-